MSKVWTSEVTEKLVTDYSAAVDAAGGKAVDLTGFADQYGVSVHSVRSKLVSAKVYVKAEAKAVGGASTVRKIHIVKRLEDATGLTLTSFEKATKTELEALASFLETQGE